MLRALLRFDVSPAIGAGHMARCLALGGELEQRGWEIVCAVNPEGVPFLPIPKQANAIVVPTRATLDQTRTGPLNLIIVDHYHLEADYEARLRAVTDRIVAIDDLHRTHAADVVIDTAPCRTDGTRYSRMAQNTLVLLGTDYALLRPEFARAGGTRPGRFAAGTLRALISMGATDPENATSLVLDALAGCPAVVEVTVVLGAGAPHLEPVRRRLAESHLQGMVLSGVSDMATLAAGHDLAIGSPGTSALERACLGMPQILLMTADNQAVVARGLAEAGAALFLGSAAAVTVATIRQAIESLASDPAAARRQGDTGGQLVDGLGAARVAALLTTEPEDATSRRLAARRIRLEDSNVLLAWQTHATTRRYSFDPRPPDPERHRDFVAGRIADRHAMTEIMTRDGRPVAIVRADPVQHGRIISIVVDPALRGQGIGRAALDYIDALLPTETLIAHVDHRNSASLALFRAAGYREQGRLQLVVENIPAAV